MKMGKKEENKSKLSLLRDDSFYIRISTFLAQINFWLGVKTPDYQLKSYQLLI
jgi:hypothetical protein